MAEIKEKIQLAEEQTNTEPTEGQKISGNYKKGKVIIKGLRVTIENPVGSIRSGRDLKGNVWSNKQKYTYGYFNGTVGKDGDPIDVYLGPIVDQDFNVYIIDQLDEDTRAFDEHKVMFGFESSESAKKAYLSCYNKDWRGFGNIEELSLSKFKLWINNKDAIKYPAKKLNMTSKIDLRNAAEGGERLKVIRLFGEVFEGKTLANLQKQAGDINKFDKLVIEIASPGGSVSEGLEIMVWFDQLSAQGKQIITVVTANAYSIASLIMLAADIRLISIHGKVMVHNPMVPQLEYVNANELTEYINSLRELEAQMYELYQIFTNLTREQIKALMDNETYLLPQEAVDYGFADMVVDIKPKSYEMTTNLKKEINMSKTLNMLNRVIALVNKSEFINQSYSTELGQELEIFQADPATYKIGDRTSVEDSGSDGIKLSDGSKLIIEDYVIKDIIRVAEDAPIIEVPEGEMPVVENAEDSPVIEAPVVETPVEEKVAEFNEGPAPVVEAPKTKDQMPAKVIEKVESTITTKETVAVEVEDEKAKAQSEEEKMKAQSDEEVMMTPEEMMRCIKGLQEDVVDLKGKLDESTKASEDKFAKVAKFEEAAAEAIDTLASNTTSNFKPEAKSKVVLNAGGTIFTRAKVQAGLK